MALQVPIYRSDGTIAGAQLLDERVFGVPVVPALVQQAVVAEAANARRPIAHTKTKGEVRGGGRKPWRQKGTGRARQGSIRSPQWRGGGVVFGPRRDRSYAVRLNKKMKRRALLMALSDKVAGQRLVVLDRLEVSGKAKDWQAIARSLWPAATGGSRRRPSALVMVPTVPLSLRRSTGNVPGLETIRTDSLNVSAILRHAYAVTTVQGVQTLEQWLRARAPRPRPLGNEG
jgi:large subunit ribosomal protein L4